jgi:hypothetical protein
MGFFDKTKPIDRPSSYPRKLSQDFSGALRTFSFWIANGTVGHPLLKGIDYRPEMLLSPSLTEQAYAIFANVIEFSEDGMPTNAKYAEYRAAQYIRSYCDRTYVVSPPFEGWEVELFGHRRAKTASLGHQSYRVETVRFGSTATCRDNP